MTLTPNIFFFFPRGHKPSLKNHKPRFSYLNFQRRLTPVAARVTPTFMRSMQNIARGTTDPGYWLSILSYLYSLFSFQLKRSLEIQSQCPGCLYECPGCLRQCLATCIGYKFGQQLALLASVTILATKWRHLHCHIGHSQDCPVGIISRYRVIIIISQSHIS